MIRPHHTRPRDDVDVGKLPEFPMYTRNLESPATLPVKRRCGCAGVLSVPTGPPADVTSNLSWYPIGIIRYPESSRVAYTDPYQSLIAPNADWSKKVSTSLAKLPMMKPPCLFRVPAPPKMEASGIPPPIASISSCAPVKR